MPKAIEIFLAWHCYNSKIYTVSVWDLLVIRIDWPSVGTTINISILTLIVNGDQTHYMIPLTVIQTFSIDVDQTIGSLFALDVVKLIYLIYLQVNSDIMKTKDDYNRDIIFIYRIQIKIDTWNPNPNHPPLIPSIKIEVHVRTSSLLCIFERYLCGIFIESETHQCMRIYIVECWKVNVYYYEC